MNPHVKEYSTADSRVIGLFDFIVPYSSPWQARLENLHSRTAIATSAVEAIAVPARELARALDAEATQERLTALRDIFPMTQGMSDRDLSKPSRVERNREATPLHRLFEVSDVRRHTTLWMQAETLPAEGAKIVLVLEGVVHFKIHGAVTDAVSAGAVIGEDALRGIPYQCTAFVHTPRARIMFISAADFRTHFLGGRLLTEEDLESPQFAFFRQAEAPSTYKRGAARRFTEKLNLAHLARAAEGAGDNRDPARSRSLQAAKFNAQLSKTCTSGRAEMRKDDYDELLQAEWKRLKFKKLPPRVAPPGGRDWHRSTEEDFSCYETQRRFRVRGPGWNSQARTARQLS